MHSTSPRRSRFAVLGSGLALAVCLAAAGLAVGSPASAQALPMVERQGAGLVAGGDPFRVWGFNYGVGDRYAILSYFDEPTKARLRQVVSDMREARSLGANTLRVYLELKAFMTGPREPNPRALGSLSPAKV